MEINTGLGLGSIETNTGSSIETNTGSSMEINTQKEYKEKKKIKEIIKKKKRGLYPDPEERSAQALEETLIALGIKKG